MKPVKRSDPLPIVEGWAMDLYCQYSAGVAHDMDTHGVSYGGTSRADARGRAQLDGWQLHRNGLATCPRCASYIRLFGKPRTEQAQNKKE